VGTWEFGVVFQGVLGVEGGTGSTVEGGVAGLSNRSLTSSSLPVEMAGEGGCSYNIVCTGGNSLVLGAVTGAVGVSVVAG